MSPPDLQQSGSNAALLDLFADDPVLFQLALQLIQLQQQESMSDEDFRRVLQLTQIDGGPPPASDAAVRNLHRFTVDSCWHTVEDTECCVCMDRFDIGHAVAQMPCSHVYHDDCLMPWLRLHNTCPKCRSSVEPQQLGRAPLGHDGATNVDSGDGSGAGLLGALSSAATAAWNWMFNDNTPLDAPPDEHVPGAANVHRNEDRPVPSRTATLLGNALDDDPISWALSTLQLDEREERAARDGGRDGERGWRYGPGRLRRMRRLRDIIAQGNEERARGGMGEGASGRGAVTRADEDDDLVIRHAMELSRAYRQPMTRPYVSTRHARGRTFYDNDTIQAMVSAMSIGELQAEIEATGRSVAGCVGKEALARLYADCVLAQQQQRLGVDAVGVGPAVDEEESIYDNYFDTDFDIVPSPPTPYLSALRRHQRYADRRVGSIDEGDMSHLYDWDMFDGDPYPLQRVDRYNWRSSESHVSRTVHLDNAALPPQHHRPSGSRPRRPWEANDEEDWHHFNSRM